MTILMIVAFLSSIQITEAPAEAFARANTLFEAREFEAAAEAYADVLENDVRDPLVEYNLGNTLYRLGRIGEARLHYERALRLQPSFEDANFNISFIEERFLKASLRESNFTSVDQVFWSFTQYFPPSTSFPVAVVAYIVLNLLIGLRAFRPGIIPSAAFWTLLIGSSMIAAIAFTAMISGELLANSTEYGVIIASDVDAASEPSLEAPSRFPAPVAMKVVVSRSQGDWLEIILPNGTKGWVTKEHVTII